MSCRPRPPIEAFLARYLDCEEVVDAETGEAHVLVWLDFDGKTIRAGMPVGDARDLCRALAGVLDALDDDEEG